MIEIEVEKGRFPSSWWQRIKEINHEGHGSKLGSCMSLERWCTKKSKVQESHLKTKGAQYHGYGDGRPRDEERMLKGGQNKGGSWK